MAAKYIFDLRSRVTTASFVTSPGCGASGSEPSCGTSAGELMGGETCAEPKIYGTNEWSSRPHTPCDPAGSSVYVKMSLRMSSRYLEMSAHDPSGIR
jgi:hypothetical protein